MIENRPEVNISSKPFYPCNKIVRDKTAIQWSFKVHVDQGQNLDPDTERALQYYCSSVIPNEIKISSSVFVGSYCGLLGFNILYISSLTRLRISFLLVNMFVFKS